MNSQKLDCLEKKKEYCLVKVGQSSEYCNKNPQETWLKEQVIIWKFFELSPVFLLILDIMGLKLDFGPQVIECEAERKSLDLKSI